MKLLCKRCMKKLPLKELKDTCTDSQCELVYNFSSIEIGFAGTNFKPGGKEPTIISEYESPEPPAKAVITELTQEQWIQLLESGLMNEYEVHGPKQ